VGTKEYNSECLL